MSMSAGFSSPSLELDEIAQVIHTWGYPIVQEDLRPPKGLKPDVVQMIYAFGVQKLTGLSIDELEESAARSLSVIDEGQELIAPSARLHVLLYHVTRVAEGAGIEDFSMMDLVSPELTRTRSCLSAVINFVRFSEERLPFLEGLQQQYTKACAERDQLSREMDEMRQTLDNHEAKLKSDEPICAQLTMENRNLTASLRELYEEQNAVFQESETYKVERDKLILRKAVIQDEFKVALDTNARTKSKIVQSPERIKRIISTMGEIVQEERRNIAAIDTKARALKLKLDNMVTIVQDIQSNVRHLATFAREDEALDYSLDKLAKVKSEFEKYTVMRKESELKLERVDRVKANIEQKLERELKYAEDQRQRSQETLEKLKREFEEMSVERRDNDQWVEETMREAAEMERKMAEHLRENEEEMTKLLTEYWKLRHQTEIYMETLGNKLGLDLENMVTL